MTMYPIQTRNQSHNSTHDNDNVDDALFCEFPEQEEEDEEDQGSTFTFDLSNSFNNTGKRLTRGQKPYHSMASDGGSAQYYGNSVVHQTDQSGRGTSRSISPLVSPGKTYSGFHQEPQMDTQEDSAIFQSGYQEMNMEGEQYTVSHGLNDTGWLSDICSDDSYSELNESIWGDPRKLQNVHTEYANDLELSINLNSVENQFLNNSESEGTNNSVIPEVNTSTQQTIHPTSRNETSISQKLPNRAFTSSHSGFLGQHTAHNSRSSTPESEEFSYGHPTVQTSGFHRFRGSSAKFSSSKTAPLKEPISTTETGPSYPRISPIPSSHDATQMESSLSGPPENDVASYGNGNTGNNFSESLSTPQISHGENPSTSVASMSTRQPQSTGGRKLPPPAHSSISSSSSGNDHTYKRRSFLPRRKPVSQHTYRDKNPKNNYALPSSRLRPSAEEENVQRAQTAAAPQNTKPTSTKLFETIPLKAEQNDLMVQSVRSSECTSQDDEESMRDQQDLRKPQAAKSSESVTSGRTEKSSNVRMEYDKAVREKNKAKIDRRAQDDSSKKEKKINKLIDMLMRERPVNMPAEQLKSQVLERLKDAENSRRAEEVNLEMKSAKEKQDFEELKHLLLEEEREKSSAKSGRPRERRTQGVTLSSRNVTTGESAREKISKKDRDKDTASELSSFLETASTECDEASVDDEVQNEDEFNNAQRFGRRKDVHPFDRNRELLSQSSAEIAERELLDSLADIDDKLNARQAAIRDSRKRELQFKLSDPRQNAEKEDSNDTFERKPSLSGVAKNMLDDFTGARRKTRNK